MTVATNENRCILASICRKAGDPSTCNNMCESFIAMHGASGKGGRVGAAEAPADYRMVTVANSPVRESQPKVYEFIDKYLRTFERQWGDGDNAYRIKSLYLVSESPGTGKTTTAVAVMNEWVVRHYVGALKRNRQPIQRPAYFLDVNEWQTLFNEFNRRNIPQDIAEKASAEYYRKMAEVKTAPFAVLDDIGVRSASEAFRGDLHAVINHRIVNVLPTVYTSNIAIYGLVDVFDKRLYDRVRDNCFELNFEGESKRGLRK